MCPPPPLYPEDTMPLLLPVLCPPPHHLSTAHARLQLATGSGQPPHTGTLGDFKRVPGTPAQFLVPHSPNPADAPGPSPAPAMAPGAPSSNPSPILAALLFSSLGKLSHPSLGAPGLRLSLSNLPPAFAVLLTAIKETGSNSRKVIFYAEKKKICSLEGGCKGKGIL